MGASAQAAEEEEQEESWAAKLGLTQDQWQRYMVGFHQDPATARKAAAATQVGLPKLIQYRACEMHPRGPCRDTCDLTQRSACRSGVLLRGLWHILSKIVLHVHRIAEMRFTSVREEAEPERLAAWLANISASYASKLAEASASAQRASDQF